MEISKLEEYVENRYYDFMLEVADKNRTSICEIDYNHIKEYVAETELEDAYKIIDEILNLETQDKNKIFPRIINAPTTHSISMLDSQDVGSFISTTAMIKSITNTKPELVRAVFICDNCKNGQDRNVEEDGKIVPPTICPRCGKQTKFELRYGGSLVKNVRYLQLEEPLELRRNSGVSPSFNARIEGHMASAEYDLKVGDIVDIAGKFELQHNPKYAGEYNFNIDLKSITSHNRSFQSENLTEEDIEAIQELSNDPHIFERLTNSIAPRVIGYDKIKEGLVLQQFGSVESEDGERNTIHILLIGDPGVAKTLFLDSICAVSPKSVRTGTGSTEAGLTATVTKDEMSGQFVAIAGAAVLADNGILAMDEYDKLSPDNQKALNEPMESGVVTITKASISTQLSARANYLCVANPLYSRFSKQKPINLQIDIPESTLTRFDIIFVIEDVIDAEKDYDLMKSILRKEKNKSNYDIIPTDLLMKYIVYAKENVKPHLSDEAVEYIAQYYSDARQFVKDDDEAVPISNRNGMGIGRLAIARAKSELREIVTVEDVKSVIDIINYSWYTMGLDLSNAGSLGSGTTEKDIRIITALEEQITDFYEEYGNFNFSSDDVGEIKDNVMFELGASLEEVNKVYNQAFLNCKKSRK